MGKYDVLARKIVENVGGKENVLSLTHCVTRLRFQIKDESKVNLEELKNMEGIVTVIKTAGQYQIVIGNHVPEVYKDVCNIIGIITNSSEKIKEKKKFSEVFFDIVSGIFMPSMGVLCGSGILKGINTILNMYNIMPQNSGLGMLLDAAADAMFLFFPIVIGYNAFLKLGGNKYLGLALGAALCYPKIQNVDLTIFSYNINTSYTSTVLPIIIISLLAVPCEKILNKYIPDVIKNFVVPTIILLIFLPLGFGIIGPLSNKLGDYINNFIQQVYSINPILAGGVMGFIWQILVMLGCHIIVILTLITGLMSGIDQPLLAALGVCSFVQTGSVFAIWLKTKDSKLKQLALPAWISGIFGVTEPAIYGITLPNGKQFILTCVGSAIAGALGMFMGVSSYAMAGLGIFLIQGEISQSNPNSLTLALILALLATIIGFIISFITFKDKNKDKNDGKKENEKELVRNIAIKSPMSGEIIPLEKVEDEAFSKGILGKGIAINPTEGKLYAPFDGTVLTVFPTLHAITMVSDTGVELLIHVGMNTVNLDGKYFYSKVKEGDKIKCGDLLLTFDMNEIKKEYSLVTPVIITNYEDYLDILEVKDKNVKNGENILNCIIS